MRNSIRFARLSTLLALSALPLLGCTDLTETPKSNITPGNFYRNEAEVLGGVASVYAMTRNDGTLWGYYNISEISTDEMIVPTRGQDWFDNGRWLEIHRQTWQAASPAGLDDINRIWVDSYKGVARANVVLDALKNVTVSNQAGMVAELRTLRAFYYYLLLDAFGGAQKLLAETGESYRALRQVNVELAELERGEQEKLRLLDLWQFQRREIESLRLQRGEDTALENERRRM